MSKMTSSLIVLLNILCIGMVAVSSDKSTDTKTNQHFDKMQRNTQEMMMNEAQQTIANISTIRMDVDMEISALLKKRLESIDVFQNRFEWLQQMLKLDINDIISGEFKLENKIKCLFKLLDNLKRLKNHLINMKLSISSIIAEPVYDWRTQFPDSFNYLSLQYDWYNFLQKTYSFFASYAVQKDVSLYNVANLSDWGKLNRSSDLFIDANNFNEFVQKITTLNFTPTESNLRELNDIINVTLKSAPQHEYNDKHSSVTIKGNFIKSSDILPFTDDTTLKRINVFVVDTFYVDCNLTMNPFNEIELNIMAHTWSIQKEATFRLNGANGLEYYNSPTQNGTAGDHGYAGTNAGDFFGFANRIIDGDLLSVELNGGNGGNGQDGSGNEDYGHQFNTVEFEVKTKANDLEELTEITIENYFKKLGYRFDCSRNVQSSFGCMTLHGIEYLEYVLYPRRCCGKTGRGGEGGTGGFKGYYTFMHANNKSQENPPKHTESDGVNGSNGTDGRTCSSFELHVSAVLNWSHVLWYKVHVTIEKLYHTVYSPCSVEYKNNEEKKEQPKLKSNKITYGLAAVEYKRFLLEKMSFEPLLNTIQKTYNAIDSNSAINDAYSPTEFAIEMNALEKEFNQLNGRINLSPMYSDLLKRMDEYSKIKANTTSNIDRKLLTHLYLIGLSKKMSMENDHNGDLIIDINSFFHVIIGHIHRLNENERIHVITKQRNRYVEEMQAKISEANDLIKTDIEPEIAKIFAILSVEMEKTLKESIELQTEQIINIQQNEEKANKIQRMAMIHKLITIARISIGIFSLDFGTFFQSPVNQLTNSNDGTSRSMLNTMMFAQENYREKIDLMDREFTQLVAIATGNATGNANSGNSSFHKDLIDLHSKVKRVKSKQSYERTSILLLECIKFVQNALANPTNETVEISERMERTANFLIASASNYQNYYYRHSRDEQILERINKAISQDMKTLTELMRLEDQIFTDLLPTINEMRTHLWNVEQSLANKSSVALDVMKWKTHNILQAIQKKLGNAVSGRKTEYEINNCLVRLGETMNLLIDIYDHIQGNQEQSRLISYLSDLQTINQQTNVQLPDSIEFVQLEINLQANLILSLYNRALNAFKQAIFPYAAEYLDLYQLPNTLAANDSDINQYTTIVTQKIQSLSQKMQLFNATVINTNDMSIHVSEFNNDPGSRGPFYAWSNHEVRDQIEQLFNGKKIYLLADVSRSDKRNAVKFSRIDIEFWSANQTIKGHLNEILQSFHVSMTHMGESNYRCNNQFYTIPSRPFTIEFSFGGKNNKPTDRNAAYDKLVAGFGLLSPYTLWAVQLKHGDFDKLKPYIGLIDIELHGFGQYLEEGASICHTNLEKYYKLKDVAHD